MKKLTFLPLIILLLVFSSCKNEIKHNDDCQELTEMSKADQKARTSESNEPLEVGDKTRRLRVLELLAEGKVITNNDKLNAGLILQHTALTFCNGEIKSFSPENYYLAYNLLKNSFENGNKDAAYLTAATYDRYLLYTNGYQKYGTQRIIENNEELWAPIDTTTTDSERQIYGIPSLKKLLKMYKMKERE